jgi:hypothetical protein
VRSLLTKNWTGWGPYVRGVASVVVLGYVLLVACGCSEKTVNKNTEDTSHKVGDAGGNAKVTWKTPTIEQFREASEWGAAQDEEPAVFWTVCTSGPCQIRNTWNGQPFIQVFTPLALTAESAYLSHALDEDALADTKDLVSNEIHIGLVFAGTLWDADTDYEVVITQGDLVLRPIQSSVDWKTGGEIEAVTIECRLKIEPLDPNRPFWFSASQEVGGKTFLFKIDPDELGAAGFF